MAELSRTERVKLALGNLAAAVALPINNFGGVTNPNSRYKGVQDRRRNVQLQQPLA